MPSAMLEQEAQMFGLRDKAFPVSGIGSPQHRQIRKFIGREEENNSQADGLKSIPPAAAGMKRCTVLSPDTASPNLEWRSPRIPSREPAASASSQSISANPSLFLAEARQQGKTFFRASWRAFLDTIGGARLAPRPTARVTTPHSSPPVPPQSPQSA